MSQVPIDRLIRLMTVLLLNVRDGSQVSATMPGDERGDDEDEQRLWREVVMDKVRVGATFEFLFSSSFLQLL